MVNSSLPEETPLYEHYRYTADRGQALLRIDKYLCDHIEHVSRNRIQAAAEAGCIKVNDITVKSNYRVKPLDVITVLMAHPPYDNEVLPEYIPLDIPYEDPYLLIVNKPAGLVVHPGHGNYTGTLVNALAHHLRNLPAYDPNDPQVGLVHRIDKDTSGLLVVAKTPLAKTSLGEQFFNKTTRRTYHALVWGQPKDDHGRIETYIGRNPHDRLQMAVVADETQGKHAVTHYQVLERLGYVSLIECRLETGRTHQIRVHLKHLGHPLFNDERYGGHEILRGVNSSTYRQFIRNCFDLCPRQALHAHTLGFTHPHSHEDMDFEAPLPSDMTQLIEKWKHYINQQ
jgi:23S rRNA pseudouridine1911/1915/1917 synthase